MCCILLDTILQKYNSISPGSDRPLCDAKLGISLQIPEFGNYKVNNGGCGQHPGNVPMPNYWIDFRSKIDIKCWVCLALPSGCEPNIKHPNPVC